MGLMVSTAEATLPDSPSMATGPQSYIRLRNDHPSKQVGCGCVLLPLLALFVVSTFLLLFRVMILSCVNY